MAHWLVKSEASAWSWDDQMRAGTDAWTGVRNHQAANYLKAMRTGDRAFFYHSVDEKRVVGVIQVVREAFADPTDPSGRWVAVDVRPVAPLPHPVTLAAIKADPRLAELALIRQSRLSVMPVDDAAWQVICALGGVAA
jgi:predicted RNA-binding protein with PUA-like domain